MLVHDQFVRTPSRVVGATPTSVTAVTATAAGPAVAAFRLLAAVARSLVDFRGHHGRSTMPCDGVPPFRP